ncbi:hypothetical protein [Saprospira grandis]|uniref:hypothetical protein n=1 Tax=Saprospira grandis TaxID=1008 RepID=UPI0020A1CDE5|nr:hypothetical protein [Saprospira grandis]
MMIDIAEEEFEIPIRKKYFTRTVDKFQKEEKISLSSLCRLVGINRQKYYRSKAKVRSNQGLAEKVVALVQEVRNKMPRLGGRKLYHLLQAELKALGVGRDKFFTILRANNLLVRPRKTIIQRQIPSTTTENIRTK